MKLVYVTTMLPYGAGESFLIAEAAQLARTEELLIVPMYPRGEIVHGDALALRSLVVEQPLLSVRIVCAAVAETLRAPASVARLLFVVLQSRSARVLAKNLLVLPKGLWLGRRARRLGADHIHAHWASTPSTLALVAAGVSRVPWSFTAHRWDIAEDNLLAPKLRRACFARAISERGASALRSRAPRDAHVRVIRLGVDVSTGRAGTSCADRDRDLLNVVVAANLVDVKGHIHLLEALPRVGDAARIHLDVIGDGPLRTSLHQAAAALGVGEQVTFHGVLSHEDVVRRLRAGTWDVCVLPSVVTASGEHEGIPVSLLEAMSAGVPVVATSTGSIPELLSEDAGVLVPPRDPNALASALRYLAGDPHLRERIGQRGRERVLAEFDARRTTQLLLAEIGKWRG